MKKYERPLPLIRRLCLSNDEYSIYKMDMREYRVRCNLPLRGVQARKIIYPLVAFGVKLFRLSNRHTIEIIGDRRTKTNVPIIFAVTHIGKFDIERVFEACKTSCWIFNGDPDTVYHSFDGFSLSMSGVVLIDTESETDRHVAMQTAIQLLRQGGNLMFFPEGIWNVEPSIPVLPLYPGIAKIAMETGAEIIPVAIEQYGSHFQIIFGANMDIQEKLKDCHCNDIKQKYSAILHVLRDEMATLKWEIFEKNTGTRDDYTDVALVQQRRVQEKLSEWTDKRKRPFFSYETLKGRQFCPEDCVCSSTVFNHLSVLDANNKTAFLFNKRLTGF